MTRVGWVTALVLAGVGLYFTRGVLDIVSGPHGVLRVAMLPPWWEAGGFVVGLAAVAFVAGRGERDPDVVLPLCALSVLAVPYLPWLADRLPILRGFAGPARDLLWLVVFWMVGGRGLAAFGWNVAAAARPIVIFLISAAVYGAAAWRLTATAQYPAGDEPHYLVITQSLLNDHDLRIENNHQREDYRAYFSRPLKPDYLTRGKDGQIYSIHPVGLPVLAAPAFALGGYPGVLAMLVAIAAAAATLLWRWSRDATGSTAAATFAWASVALTAPFLFNAFAVYPEVPAALAVLVSLSWRRSSTSAPVLVAKGIAIGLLPWLSTKYAPMAAVVALVVALRARWNVRVLATLAAPIAVLFAAWFAFFYWIWGTLSPSAPYGSSDPMTFGYLMHGAPGLFFDQEYGVVAYAPVLALAIVGFARLLRSGGDEARRAIELLAVLAALVCTVGAFQIWWGGSAAPGRPVASGVLLLGMPIAAVFATSSSRPATRAICHVLLAASLAVAVAMVVVQDGSLLHNDRDGSAALLDWMSPAWPVTAVMPSYIAQPVATAAWRTLAWLALGALVAWSTRRVAPRGFGAAGLAAIALGCSGAVVLASATRPAFAAGVDPEARARVPLLDGFDAHRRPIALLYDPFSRISTADALRRVSLTAHPGQRIARQPIELLWNARFSLPAGDYRLTLLRPDEASVPAAVGVQVGRVGPPLERWDIAGAESARTVALPIDAALFGARVLSPKGLATGELRLTPLRVVDESRRIVRPPVISAFRVGMTVALFHDDTTFGESTGFWTHGRATTQVTFAVDPGAPATIDVTVRCGPIANHVSLTMNRWREQFDLARGNQRAVSIPTLPPPDEAGVRLAPVDIAVRDAFVPAEIDPASTDRRALGCRVELPGEGRR